MYLSIRNRLAPLFPLLRAILFAAVAGIVTVLVVGVFTRGYCAGYLSGWREFVRRDAVTLAPMN
jgi:hypothetical protein